MPYFLGSLGHLKVLLDKWFTAYAVWRLGFYGSCSAAGFECIKPVVGATISTIDWLVYDGTERDLPTFQS